ncbi:MAG: DNA methyltransferase, partial [Anaerolineales bacterium]
IRKELNLPDAYHREPFASNIAEGKQDPIYKVHGYHTKVPPKAIIQYILHYTDPGDILLDAFCGSGMMGIAAQLCGKPSKSLLENIGDKANPYKKVQWGARKAILSDLSPVATTIAANYNLPVNATHFDQKTKSILSETRKKTAHLYTPKEENTPFCYGIWSQIFICPDCSAQLNFMELAYNLDTRKVSNVFQCPNCATELTKRTVEKAFTSEYDPVRKSVHRQIKYELYMVARGKRRRSSKHKATEADRILSNQMEQLPFPEGAPVFRLPLEKMYHGSRLQPKGAEYIHDLYFNRQLHTLTMLWKQAKMIEDARLRSAVLFLFDQVLMNASKLARFPQLSPLGGVFYLPSMVAENEPVTYLEAKLKRVKDHFASGIVEYGQVAVSTNSATSVQGVSDNSVDYVFTDPPFGENIFYADLNLIIEAWYGVQTSTSSEAIIDKFKSKGINEYQRLMTQAFTEYYRVLKPGRWITVVFHNSDNAVWNTIQQSMIEAGFIVADVRMLDKQQRSYRQATSEAMKQDLIVSAYKTNTKFEEQISNHIGQSEGVWQFVHQHLYQLPIVVENDGEIESLRERLAYMLFDRMVAFHIQKGVKVPVSASEFNRDLDQFFVNRDGMYFLPEQVAIYDGARLTAKQVSQMALFVCDEKSAILWLRQQLDPKMGGIPQTRQEITPNFLSELNKAKHESLPELDVLLEQNFLKDETDRWYVPDPSKTSDLEQLRQRALLREFRNYLEGNKRLRQFRTEAVRAGFADAYQRRDFQTILKVAQRLPERVLQEDPDLLMYFDAASLRAE